MTTMPTTRLFQTRMNDDDRESLSLIRSHFGLPSDAAAVRYALRRVAEGVKASEGGKVPPKASKSPKAPKGEQGS